MGERKYRKAMPQIVNGIRFPSKSALKQHVQQILQSYEYDEVLSEEHQAFMKEFIKGHREYDIKAGKGVKELYVGDSGWRNKCFYIRRVDGTVADISYISVINSPSQLAQYKQCCREAVYEDNQAFKREFFRNNPNPVCEITGVPLTWDNSHVDHAPPLTFADLMEVFIKGFHMNVEETDIPLGEDNSTITEFGDKELAEKFRAFHNKLAKLRVISAEANLSLKAA